MSSVKSPGDKAGTPSRIKKRLLTKLVSFHCLLGLSLGVVGHADLLHRGFGWFLLHNGAPHRDNVLHHVKFIGRECWVTTAASAMPHSAYLIMGRSFFGGTNINAAAHSIVPPTQKVKRGEQRISGSFATYSGLHHYGYG